MSIKMVLLWSRRRCFGVCDAGKEEKRTKWVKWEKEKSVEK